MTKSSLSFGLRHADVTGKTFGTPQFGGMLKRMVVFHCVPESACSIEHCLTSSYNSFMNLRKMTETTVLLPANSRQQH